MKNWATSRAEALRLVGTWLACLVVLCGVWLGSILYFWRSAQTASSIRLMANRIRIHELEARRAEKDFMLRSLSSPNFFRDGRSEYLDRHAARMIALTEEIEHLGEQVPADQVARTERLLALVQRYEQGFRELVEAYRERGFGTLGHEGVLTRTLQTIEDFVDSHDKPALRNTVLNLSRQEQGYLLHRSPEKAERVAMGLAALRECIRKEDELAKADRLRDAIEEYEVAFAALVKLEERIGRTEELGLRGKLREEIHTVEPTVEGILSDAVRADGQANRTLMIGILVACLIIAILLSLALFYAQAARLRNRSLIRMNLQMEEDHRKLLQAERLAAIGQMVAGLAHESRNAFQRTHACLDMLAQKVTDRPEALALVSRIEESQDYLHLLYEQVREYAAPLRVERSMLRLDEVVQSAWDHLELLLQGRNVRLRQCVDDMDIECEADAFALQQVFKNILENSLAACADPVEIEIRYGEAQSGPKSMLEVSVRDNGPGLNAEQRARIFEPFYTTKIKGTGLGMAIAKRLVEAHGGAISVGLANRRGAEIVVTLPRKGGKEGESCRQD